jgi:thiamine kinase-like enzyme
LKPAVRSPHHAWLINEISKVLKKIAPKFATIPGGARWPVGLCHGDLNAHNGLKDPDDRYWLIDWESAGVRPIVLDLAHVYLTNPTIRPAALDVLRALDPNDEAMQPLQQLAIGSAFEMRKRSQRRMWKIERNARLMNQKRSEAAVQFDSKIANLKAAIAALAD